MKIWNVIVKFKDYILTRISIRKYTRTTFKETQEETISNFTLLSESLQNSAKSFKKLIEIGE